VTKVSGHGRLELRHAEFRYPGAEHPVLCDISLSAGPGEVTAVIGGTGSGKTTLVSLIPRLMDVTGGAVLVDGVDVRELDPVLLSDMIGLVPQRPYLFSGTVATNLRYGNQEADRPGGGLRPADGGRPGRAYRPGRHQRVRRAAAAAGHRQGAGAQAGDLPVR
jgi:ABC-type multidrug transport system fused ATPase/permease subunit